MNVKNMTSSNGNKVANQFIVNDLGFKYYQNYNSVIVKIDLLTNDIYLDEKYWNFSNTTSKYRNKFLNETTKQTIAKIKSNEYKLIDLNTTQTPQKIQGAGVNLSWLNTEGMSK